MRIWIAATAALLLPGVAAAQDHSKWFGVTWGMAAPTDHSKDFTNDYSFRGLGLEWRELKGRTSFGLSLGWNALNEESVKTSSLGQVDITGDQFRYINAYSILAALHAYGGGSPGRARPFLGLKVGTYYINRRVDVGLWTASDNNWHFGLAPELGFAMPMRGGLEYESFYTVVRYNYAFSAGDSPYQSWFGIDVGVAVRTR